jgi:P-type Cu2+ transporter
MGAPCDHCGLPLGRRRLRATVGGGAGVYCCFGCVLAQQVTRARGDDGHAAAVLVRLGLAVFFAMNVMMVSMPTYVPAVYGGDGPVDGPLFLVLRWLAMAFAAPVLALLGGPILRAAWQAGRAGVANADALVVLGAAAAYGLSIANTLAGRTAVYYDTAAMLLVLVTLGRWLEARARADAGAAVRRTLARGPERARREDGVAVAPDALVPGDVVLVTPGETFPADGVVLSGAGGVDEAALTGEALPVARGAGDAVAGGTCSVDGTFRVRVIVPAAASATARIAALVEATLRERTRIERIADRVAGVLVPLVLVVAVAAGTAAGRAEGVDRGVLVALAVLVVACPCGLGLATPLAIRTGLVHAACRGVVVRGGPALERLAAVRTVLFDKTGTLTGPVPRLARIEPRAGHTADDVLAMAAALEAELAHPIARGIVAAARDRGLAIPRVTDLEAAPGRGVRGEIGAHDVALGGPRWIASITGERIPPETLQGASVVVACDRHVVGCLTLEETLVADAERAVAELRAAGVAVGVLTGDVRATVLSPLFRPHEMHVGLAAEDKVGRVRAARRDGAVAMVGDGFNDAAALAAADVGIAVGGAVDLTRTTADAVIVGGAGDLPWLLAYARQVSAIARQNLGWAFGYNAIAVGLAATGRLDPVVAALAMIASSLSVVANARRLCPRPARAAGAANVAPGVPAPIVAAGSATMTRRLSAGRVLTSRAVRGARQDGSAFQQTLASGRPHRPPFPGMRNRCERSVWEVARAERRPGHGRC